MATAQLVTEHKSAIDSDAYRHLERLVAQNKYNKDLSSFIRQLSLSRTPVGDYLQSWSNDINTQVKLNNLNLKYMLTICKYNKELCEILLNYIRTDFLKSSGLASWIRPELKPSSGVHKYLKDPKAKITWPSQ